LRIRKSTRQVGWVSLIDPPFRENDYPQKGGSKGRPTLRRLLVGAIALNTVIGAGCGGGDDDRVKDRRPPGPPRELDEIVGTIQDNADRLDKALHSGSVRVVARMKDSKGKKHVFNFDGTLLFQKPRMLRMDLRHGTGTPVMQVGSNNDEYWAWVEPEMHQMWWGRHRHAGKACVEEVSVRPDQMVSAVAMGGLPGPDAGLIGPLRASGNEHDILFYTMPDGDGSQRLVRQYYVDRRPPYQIRLIAFLDEMGRKEMTAYLDDYKAAWRGGPLIAHAVSIFWPEEDGKFTITMQAARGVERGKVAASAFVRPVENEVPRSIRGNIEQIDAACGD